ncbi:MAG: histidine kinase [Deltaproteobacteria bacterium]|nr:histidine kinase [Deltaproteobacteria bacterium]
MSIAKREQLLKEIQELKERLRDREAALPAHSVRPHQIQEIEVLEEKIAAREGK